MSADDLYVESFAEELELALKDYFVGRVLRCGKILTVVFPGNVTYTIRIE